MNTGDRDFVEGFVSQTKTEKDLSVVSDARCVLLKIENDMPLIVTTGTEFGEAQHFYKQGYKLIGGFVLSKKMVGDQLMDWACPVSRHSLRKQPDMEKAMVYCIAKAVTSYLGGEKYDAGIFDPDEMRAFDPNVINILRMEKRA